MLTCRARRYLSTNCFDAQLRDTFYMFGKRQCFREDIRGHFFSGEISHFDVTSLQAFSRKMMPDIHVFGSVVENWIFRQQSGALIVVENRRFWWFLFQDFFQEFSQMDCLFSESANAIYSASVLDKATVFCFRDSQDTAAFAR